MRHLGKSATALLLAASLAACGSSADETKEAGATTAGATTTAGAGDATATATAEPNGIADMEVDEILRRTRAAALGARTVHIDMNITERHSDMRYVHGRGAVGTVEEDGGRAEVIVIGETVYLKGDAAMVAAAGGGDDMSTVDRWTKAPSDQPGFEAFAGTGDHAQVFDFMLSDEHGFEKGEPETRDGIELLPLTGTAGTVLIQTTGEPLPRFHEADGRTFVTLDEWNEPVRLVAPKDAIDLGAMLDEMRAEMGG